MQTRIKEILREKGLTMIDLAASLGVSVSNVSMVISNGSMTIDILERYADALNVPVWELLVSSGYPNPDNNTTVGNNKLQVKCGKCGANLELTFSVKTL